jgi:hypothetical protein
VWIATAGKIAVDILCAYCSISTTADIYNFNTQHPSRIYTHSRVIIYLMILFTIHHTIIAKVEPLKCRLLENACQTVKWILRMDTRLEFVKLSHLNILCVCVCVCTPEIEIRLPRIPYLPIHPYIFLYSLSITNMLEMLSFLQPYLQAITALIF